MNFTTSCTAVLGTTALFSAVYLRHKAKQSSSEFPKFPLFPLPSPESNNLAIKSTPVDESILLAAIDNATSLWSTPLPCGDVEMTTCPAKLHAWLTRHVVPAKVLALDIEHHSAHSFAGHVCTIQLCVHEPAGPAYCLIDACIPSMRAALAHPADPTGLRAVLATPSLIVLAHGASSDVRWLATNFGIHVRSLVDTYDLAHCANEPKLGLAAIVTKYAPTAKLDKAIRASDWRTRPLTSAQVSYALADTTYLLPATASLCQALRTRPDQLARALSRAANTAAGSSDPVTARLRAALQVSPRQALRVFNSWAVHAARGDEPELASHVVAHLQARVSGTGLATATQLAQAAILAVYMLLWQHATGAALDEAPISVCPNAELCRAAAVFAVAAPPQHTSPEDVLRIVRPNMALMTPRYSPGQLPRPAHWPSAARLWHRAATWLARAWEHGVYSPITCQALVRGVWRGQWDRQVDVLRWPGVASLWAAAKAAPRSAVAHAPSEVWPAPAAPVAHSLAELLEVGASAASVPAAASLPAAATGTPVSSAPVNSTAIAQAKKAARFERKMASLARKSKLYHNIELCAPDGTVLAKIDVKKHDWYIRKGLVTVSTTEDGYPRITLLKEPNGHGRGNDDAFHLAEKRNECTMCGAEQHLCRFYVVPKSYRAFFPDEGKCYLSHDVVLVCVKCRAKLSQQYSARVKQLSKQVGIALQESVLCTENGLTYTAGQETLHAIVARADPGMPERLRPALAWAAQLQAAAASLGTSIVPTLDMSCAGASLWDTLTELLDGFEAEEVCRVFTFNGLRTACSSLLAAFPRMPPDRRCSRLKSVLCHLHVAAAALPNMAPVDRLDMALAALDMAAQPGELQLPEPLRAVLREFSGHLYVYPALQSGAFGEVERLHWREDLPAQPGLAALVAKAGPLLVHYANAASAALGAATSESAGDSGDDDEDDDDATAAPVPAPLQPFFDSDALNWIPLPHAAHMVLRWICPGSLRNARPGLDEAELSPPPGMERGVRWQIHRQARPYTLQYAEMTDAARDAIRDFVHLWRAEFLSAGPRYLPDKWSIDYRVFHEPGEKIKPRTVG